MSWRQQQFLLLPLNQRMCTKEKSELFSYSNLCMHIDSEPSQASKGGCREKNGSRLQEGVGHGKNSPDDAHGFLGLLALRRRRRRRARKEPAVAAPRQPGRLIRDLVPIFFSSAGSDQGANRPGFWEGTDELCLWADMRECLEDYESG